MPRRNWAREPVGAKRGEAWPSRSPIAPVFDDDLHVLDLGTGVTLDVFINVEGRLTTFVSVDGHLVAELPIAGEG